MRVALYYPWVYLRSGVERMILELVSRSVHDWVIFTSHYYSDQTYPGFKDLDIVELAEVSVKRNYTSVTHAAGTIIKQKIDLDNFDVMVVSSEGLGDFITFRNHSIPVICYCHTPLKIIHDNAVRRRYLEENKRMRLPFFFFSTVFKFFDKAAWKHYKFVFCNSDEVKQRILKAKLAEPEKIEVLSPGLDIERIQPSWEYQKYFIVVGRIKWWKNLELAIESFKEFKRRRPETDDFKLLLTGMVEEGSEPYFRKLKRLVGANDEIVFHRDPTEAELMDAYRSSYCLIFPSLNEDWGMTPIEAMGFGKPVIAVNRGGPAESVIDNKTGLLVNPEPKDFAQAMIKLADDPDLTRKLGEAGFNHVKKYDWRNFVDRFDSFLNDLEKRDA